MALYPADLEEHCRADGGEALIIRPIRPTDAAAHEAFFRRLRPEDVRFRFFAVRALSPEQMARFTHVDYERSMAFIAVREGSGETVGVARLVSEGDPGVAEFAVTVQPDMQGQGLATHLMHRLFDWAVRHGVRAMVGDVLADNAVMLNLLRRLGFTLEHSPADAAIIRAHRTLADLPVT